MLLVTGITGHTGQFFLQQLITHNYKGKIRCTVRKNSNVEVLKNSGLDIELVYGDLNDEKFINEIMDGVHEVLHIYNIHHSPTIIRAAISNNAKRVILVHTTGIYSKFKMASEEYKRIEDEVLKIAKKNKINITILRPTMIYGDLCDSNMSKFIKMVDKLRLFPLINGGKSLIQPVNARDLGKAYYQVLMNPQITSNKQYDLSGHKAISIKEALQTISDELNKKTIFIPVPMALSLFVAKTLRLITLGKIDIIEKVLRMGEDRSYSHEQAKIDFNYDPMPFEEGIKIEICEFLNKGRAK